MERLFSDSGNIITSGRPHLQTSKLNQLLSTRHNLSVLTQLFPTSIEPIRKPKYSIEEDADKDISQDDLDNITFENHDEEQNNTCEDSFAIW